MKKILFLIFLLGSSTLFAQEIEDDTKDYTPYFGKGHFVLKGKVLNVTEKIPIEIGVTGYIEDRQTSAALTDSYDSFNIKVPIEDVQNVTISGENWYIPFFTFPGDTINITIDSNSPDNYEMKGTNPLRSREINLYHKTYKQFHLPSISLRSSFINERGISDSIKLIQVNKLYTDNIAFIKKYIEENGEIFFEDKFLDEAYYRVAEIVIQSAFEQKSLAKIRDNNRIYSTDTMRIDSEWKEMAYEFTKVAEDKSRDMDYTIFRTTPIYREFLYYYMNQQIGYKTFYKLYFSVSGGFKDSDRQPLSQTLRSYTFGKIFFDFLPIREWYQGKVIYNAFNSRDFDEVSTVYEIFKKESTNKDYILLLDQKQAALASLKPGSPAPLFEEENEMGQKVRLADLKGKIVYLDFWNTGCGPCIQEFKNSIQPLHEKYKDYDIAYVYICIDNIANKERWKKAIKDYNLNGINLFVEGEDNAIVKNYNMKGYPHYTLIDKQGKIVENNTQRPSLILLSGESSAFDKALKKK